METECIGKTRVFQPLDRTSDDQEGVEQRQDGVATREGVQSRDGQSKVLVHGQIRHAEDRHKSFSHEKYDHSVDEHPVHHRVDLGAAAREVQERAGRVGRAHNEDAHHHEGQAWGQVVDVLIAPLFAPAKASPSPAGAESGQKSGRTPPAI